MKCCVYTRAFYETPYLDFFIEHYCNLGFDKIIILKSDDFDYNIPEKYKKYVNIHKIKNLENRSLSLYDNLVKKSGCDWALCIDVDELLLLNNNYMNIHQYINEKTLQNKKINTFYFRWGMIEKLDTEPDVVFKNILSDYKIFSNSHIKSMVRVNKLDSIYHPHMCRLKEKECIYFENNILNKNMPTKHPMTKNTYQEHILIHLHTRSIHNMITKCLVTALGNCVRRNVKKIKDLDKFKKLINNHHEESDVLAKMIECIGLKAKLPFDHTDLSVSEKKIVKLENYYIYDYRFNIINLNREKEIINLLLKKHNIDKNKYYEFIERINHKILAKNRFRHQITID